MIQNCDQFCQLTHLSGYKVILKACQKDIKKNMTVSLEIIDLLQVASNEVFLAPAMSQSMLKSDRHTFIKNLQLWQRGQVPHHMELINISAIEIS